MSACYHCKTPVGPEEARCPNCGIKLRNTRAEYYKILTALVGLEIFCLGVIGTCFDWVNRHTDGAQELFVRVLLPGGAVLATLILFAYRRGADSLQRAKWQGAHATLEVNE